MTEHTGYRDFVDELFRLGLVDRDQRDFLRRGLAVGAGPPAPVTKPSSAGLPVAHAAADRAAAAGLVTRGGDNALRIGSGPETVHWGYLSDASDPIAFVQPGEHRVDRHRFA